MLLSGVTACRIGSLVQSHGSDNPPLTWGDLEFTRGDQPGQFDLIIHFWNIHIKKPYDKETENTEPGDDALHITIKCPTAANLTFSPAHRLLTMALRRNIIVGIETVDELLDGSNSAIMIKPAHLHEPLFYKAQFKGAGLDTSGPMSGAGAAEYLRRIAYRLGWKFTTLGLHPIRRRALTDVAARLGKDTARRIAGHSPDSTTLERYYLFLGPMFDQTSTLLEQPLTDNGYTEAYRKAWAPLAMGRIEDEAVARTRGVALRNMVDRMVLADPDPPLDAATDPAARKQYRKRLRLHAHRALNEAEHTQAKATRTADQVKQRTEMLEASTFASAVLKRALESRQEAANGVIDEDQLQDWPEWDGFGEEEDEQNEAIDEDAPAEADVEDHADDYQLFVQPEEEMDDGEDIEPIGEQNASFRDMSKAFMELILDNEANQYREWAEKDRTCAECAVDETVSLADKVSTRLRASMS